MQCRKFIAEQYAQTGLNLHKESTPTEVRREPDGKLTVVVRKPDGSTEEIAGNDVVMMATGEGVELWGSPPECVRAPISIRTSYQMTPSNLDQLSDDSLTPSNRSQADDLHTDLHICQTISSLHSICPTLRGSS